MYLLGNGYAPEITVTDPEGTVVAEGPLITVPMGDTNYTSQVVLKAPDAQPTQIGLEGTFYPTFQLGRDADGNLSMPSSVMVLALPVVEVGVERR